MPAKASCEIKTRTVRQAQKNGDIYPESVKLISINNPPSQSDPLPTLYDNKNTPVGGKRRKSKMETDNSVYQRSLGNPSPLYIQLADGQDVSKHRHTPMKASAQALLCPIDSLSFRA